MSLSVVVMLILIFFCVKVVFDNSRLFNVINFRLSFNIVFFFGFFVVGLVCMFRFVV